MPHLSPISRGWISRGEEHVIANRKLIVEVVGDSSSLERTFARSTRSTKQLETGVTGSLSRVDKAFSRTQRIAAGGFIGGAAVAAGVTALKSLISAAQDSENTLGQTRIALESTGKSWQDYGKQIESAVTAQSKLGFDDEALLRSFSLFVRQSKDVGQALRENNIAMDVARARFISLEEATNIVNKAALGQAGALRRIGIDARAGASGVELLAQLEREFGGAAEDASKRSSASMDRASVAVENLQEQLGNALLPAVADVAEALASGAEDATFFAQELGKLGSIKIPAIHIPFVFDTPGGTVGGALGRVGGDIVKTAVKLQFFGIGLTAASIIKDQLSDGMDSGTRANTAALASSFEASINTMFKSALNTAQANVKTPALTPAIEFDKLPGVDTGKPIADSFGAAVDAFISAARAKIADTVKKGRAAISKEAADAARQAQRDAFDGLIEGLSLKVDQAAATAGFADDLKANTVLQNAIKKQIAVEGKTTELASQLFAARQARAAIITQQAEAARAANEKANKAIQAAQFRALGLDAEGNKPPPAIANLKKQLAQLSSRDDLTGNQKGLLDRIRKVLVDPIKKATPETRAAIKSMFDAIRQEFDKGTKEATGPLTKTTSLNANKLLEGLGLGRDMEKELRARLSSFNSAGVGLAGTKRPTGRFVSGQQPVVVESHTTVTLDGDVVGRNVTKSQQKTKRRNTKQKRGPNSGV